MKPLSKILKSGLQYRNRGISLIEGVLYLGIASSVIVLSAQMMATENNRQEEITTASQLSMFLAASQSYVATEYDSIRDQLLATSSATGAAELSVSMSALATAGYLPESFAADTTNTFGQDYALLMRAVSVQDVSVPAATMTTLQIDADADGTIDTHLLDRDNTNNEMTIESILVSYGGEAIPTTRGAPITVRSERPTAGFVEIEHFSRGAYGAFEFNISGFQDLPEYPSVGHFASIVSLSRFLSLDLIEGDSSSVIGVDDPLRRCQQILLDPGHTVASPLYAQCLATNHIYSQVVFNTYDIDGDGNPDTFPGISGLMDLQMAAGVDTNGDGNIDRLPEINNVYGVNFGSPSDYNGDGFYDAYGKIENLSTIGCASGAPFVTANTLIIDCPTVGVTGEVRATGDIVSMEDMRADRFIAGELGDQDLSEGIYNAQLLASGELVSKPTCPATTDDGLFAMQERIYVVPAAYSHPGGLPTVGVRAYAENVSASQWRVRLFNFVDEDRCTSSVNSPLTLNTSDYVTENIGSCSTPDGRADVYEVPGNIGRVFTVTRCY